jgi:hypothetical protein
MNHSFLQTIQIISYSAPVFVVVPVVLGLVIPEISARIWKKPMSRWRGFLIAVYLWGFFLVIIRT